MHFSNTYKLFQKYSLYWYYTVLIFTSKLCDPPALPSPLPPIPSWSEGGACPESSIKTKSLNTKPCPVGLSPRIMCQASPLLPKMSQNCCTHQVWRLPPSPEPLWVTLGMRQNPTQLPKISSFPSSEKSPLIDLNLSMSKLLFLPPSNSNFQVIILCNLHL